jgi:hypothetical protein
MELRLSIGMGSNVWNFFFRGLGPSLLSTEIFSKVWKTLLVKKKPKKSARTYQIDDRAFSTLDSIQTQDQKVWANQTFFNR